MARNGSEHVQTVQYPGNSSSFRLSPGKVSLQVGTSHFCGGSVLSETKVASAAHCYQSSFNVRAGSVDNQNGGQYVAGAQFVGHPAYDSNRILNDFGVITTATPFTFGDFLQPIALVAPSLNRIWFQTETFSRSSSRLKCLSYSFQNAGTVWFVNEP